MVGEEEEEEAPAASSPGGRGPNRSRLLRNRRAKPRRDRVKNYGFERGLIIG